jgi:hypothetical protein
MAIALVASQTYAFADGNAGHACVFTAGAPAVDDLDVLCVNSNTVVSTPSGFTLRVNATNSQGAYIFTRKAAGGETDTVTITTTNDHNTTVTWSRWSGTDAYSAGGFTRADNSNNTVLPATSTGTLAATGMLVLAYGALHNHDGALAASPSWSNSFTALHAVSQGAAASSASVVSFTGYKLGAGTAAETIDSVSWTNNTRNRYALWISVSAAAGGTTTPISLSGAVTPAGALARQTGKPLTGSTTPTGTALRQTLKSLAGATTPTGALTRNVIKALAGTVAPSGTLVRQPGKALTGAVTPTGAVSRLVGKTLGGTVTPSGALLKVLGRLLGGSIAPAGTLSTSVVEPVVGGSMSHADRSAASASHTARTGPTMSGR